MSDDNDEKDNEVTWGERIATPLNAPHRAREASLPHRSHAKKHKIP